MRARAHYCQQVSLQTGGRHSVGWAGLNLHLIKSHLIFIIVSAIFVHAGVTLYLFVLLLRSDDGFFQLLLNSAFQGEGGTNQVLSMTASLYRQCDCCSESTKGLPVHIANSAELVLI